MTKNKGKDIVNITVYVERKTRDEWNELCLEYDWKSSEYLKNHICEAIEAEKAKNSEKKEK